jgi:hypothetical protein
VVSLSQLDAVMVLFSGWLERGVRLAAYYVRTTVLVLIVFVVQARIIPLLFAAME